jgi:pimeloyl-ACP methyl ester carboxylesterase
MPSKLRETIVLLHDSAAGASSWDGVCERLAALGHDVFRPDLIGYGNSRQPSCVYKVAKEIQHLKGCIDEQRLGNIHLVGHGYGAFVALHLRHALRPRVKSLTLVAPLVASILREGGDQAAQAEMDHLYRRFMSLSTHNESAANFFIDLRDGAGSWQALSAENRSLIASTIPKVRREMVALHADRSQLAWLAGSWMPAAVLIGEGNCRPVRATGRQLAKAFETDPILLEGAGHMIPETHPDAVVAAVSRLASVPISRRLSA